MSFNLKLENLLFHLATKKLFRLNFLDVYPTLNFDYDWIGDGCIIHPDYSKDLGMNIQNNSKKLNVLQKVNQPYHKQIDQGVLIRNPKFHSDAYFYNLIAYFPDKTSDLNSLIITLNYNPHNNFINTFQYDTSTINCGSTCNSIYVFPALSMIYLQPKTNLTANSQIVFQVNIDSKQKTQFSADFALSSLFQSDIIDFSSQTGGETNAQFSFQSQLGCKYLPSNSLDCIVSNAKQINHSLFNHILNNNKCYKWLYNFIKSSELFGRTIVLKIIAQSPKIEGNFPIIIQTLNQIQKIVDQSTVTAITNSTSFFYAITSQLGSVKYFITYKNSKPPRSDKEVFSFSYSDKIIIKKSENHTKQFLSKAKEFTAEIKIEELNYSISYELYAVLESLSFYSAKITVRLWEDSLAYAVVLEDQNHTNVTFLSQQIILGFDQHNNPVKEFWSTKSYSNSSNYNQANLYFDNLNDGTNYTVYMTATNVMPYPEQLKYLPIQDNHVIQFKFVTPFNYNVDSCLMIEGLKEINAHLSQIIEKRYETEKQFGYCKSVKKLTNSSKFLIGIFNY
ncbi:hypothetical protein ABPG72_016285 [Tetrahymena utriculariae]